MVKVKSGSARVRSLLERHPRVELDEGPCEAAIEFVQSGQVRKVWVDRPEVECYGLVEIMDNNPIVCASEVSVPSPEGTLALVALGPIIRAGILVEAPTGVYSFEPDAKAIDTALRSVGWTEGLTTGVCEGQGDVLSAMFISKIVTPGDPQELDALFDGIYGGAFFVRRIEDGPWHPDLVADKPFAAYRLRFAPDEGESLLTVRVMAAPEGKCGAAQLVHAFNVMCGFEESLGIEPG